MEELQEKLGAVLNDPKAMEQIMAMARQLGMPESSTEAEPPASAAPDPALLQKLAAMAGQGSIDRNQQSLLSALSPYLSRQRIAKLERAMRAARMAGMATNLLGITGITGR